MTGRDLIIYILNNNLENDEIFKDDRFLNFMTVEEAAEKFTYGINTLDKLLELEKIPYVVYNNKKFIPRKVYVEFKTVRGVE